MPEATFRVRWPDGSTDACYSPSLVVHDHLAPGAEYPVADFTARVGAAMHEASERVRARYGTACTSAAATAAGVRSRAARFPGDGLVRVLSIEPPLPGSAR
ncbi:MAG: MSMEG_0570 family nitrogen starvation response protein [Quadrisphaera sp.]